MKIPYGRQNIDSKDLDAVNETLKADFITCGPKIEEFEKKFSDFAGSKYAVAVSSGTAALHVSCLAAELKKNEELLTSPMTFAASANCALYSGAKPVFVDVTDQGLIDHEKIKEKITNKSKVLIPVHYSGLPCNMEKIKEIADEYNLTIIEDACHALGARYKNSKIGDCKYSDMAVFSFHPVKHITTGEGGVITTNSKSIYEKLLTLRNHGITKDDSKFNEKSHGPWYYEMQDLGYNYRITDFQCSLGLSQLKKIDKFVAKRRDIAKKYRENFSNIKNLRFLKEDRDQFDSYHLFVILVDDKKTRLKVFNYLRKNGILCQVHYIPVYFHPYYKKLGYGAGCCPNAEHFYHREISIPIFPLMTDEEISYVIKIVTAAFEEM